MADIKRLHYFNHQFLVEADFTDEQTYHLEMRRRLNAALHGFGAGDGLAVTRSGDKEVTVTAGIAVDREGRELVLLDSRVLSLTDSAVYPAGATVHVTIAYQEQESDPSTATGVTGNTRVTERPEVLAVTTTPPGDGSVIRLGRFTLTGTGNVPGNLGDVFSDGRQTVTATLAPGAVTTAELADAAVTAAKLADNSVSAAKIVDGSVGSAELADGSVTTAKLADQAVTLAKLADNSVNGVKIVDGSVGSAELADGSVTTAKLADQAVTLAKLADNSVNAAKIVDGTVGTAELADGSVITAKLADQAVTLAKLSDNSVTGAKIVDGSVGTAELTDGSVSTAKLADQSVTGAKLVNDLSIPGRVGLGVAPGFRLDVGGRMRVRQIASAQDSAGIWFSGYYGHEFDAAFVGMQSQNAVGFWGNPVGGSPAAGWRLSVTLDRGDLTVTGNAFKPGGGAWGTLSDERLKQEITPLADAVERLLKLKPISFEWKEPEKQGNLTGPQMGFLAQDVEAVFPEWVGVDPQGYKTLTIRGFEALAVEALKRLKEENDGLREMLAKMQVRVDALERGRASSPARSGTAASRR